MSVRVRLAGEKAMAVCHAHDVVIIGAAGHMTFYPAGDNNFGCEKASTQQHGLK